MKTLRKTIATAILGSFLLGTASLQAGQNVNNSNAYEQKSNKKDFCFFYYSCVSYETVKSSNGCVTTYKVTKWYYLCCLVSVCREAVSKDCDDNSSTT